MKSFPHLPQDIDELPPELQHGTLRHYLIGDLVRLACLIITCGLIGFLFHFTVWGICIGLVIFLVLQLRALYILNQWIRQYSDQPPPKLYGMWNALVYNIHYIQKRERNLQTRMSGLIHRVQSSMGALEEAVVLVDEQHCIEWWNPAAEKSLGIQAKNRKKPIVDILQNPDVIDYFHDINKYPNGLVIQSSLLEDRYIQIKLTRFGHDSRLLVAYDVTPLRRLEQVRKDFVDNVSHELRTPLTVLSGYLETLSENEEMPPRWKRAFEQMQQQTRRMAALVTDLLLLSRLENESLPAKNQIIDMAELMDQLFNDAQGYNAEYKHMLDFNLDSHNDLIGSDIELASAFGNLITNAIKYTPIPGTITISWQDRDDEAIFSVQDTGIGIDPTHIPRLTERFYRVDSGRSRETGGTGLGLAIVKHVLAQHDAHLEIESQENVGSIFKAVFPKQRIQPPDHEEQN